MIEYLSKNFCEYKLDFICMNLLFLATGFDAEQMNKTRLQVYFEHTPAGTSNWAVLHYLQLVTSKHFLKFDFGRKENLEKYGQVMIQMQISHKLSVTKNKTSFYLRRRLLQNIL